MKNIFIGIFVTVFVLFSFLVIRSMNRTPGNTPLTLSGNQTLNSSASPSVKIVAGNTEYGVMLLSKNLSEMDRVTIASNLGVTIFRPEAIRISIQNGMCAMCDLITKAGLKALPSIMNSGGAESPSSPPTDIAKYKAALTQILQKYPIKIVVVENEENSALFYDGTPQQYGIELQAACEVAHALHLQCTNGGLVSKLVALLVYDNYVSSKESSKAQDFANRVFTTQEREALQSQKVIDQLKKGKQLLEEYKKAGADYVNFHWYIDDAKALREAVAYLASQTGLPVLSNEMGQQKNENPQQVTNLLSAAKELQLPLVIWFSMDVPGYAQAKSLVDEDGNLRPNGKTFQTFVKRSSE